MQLLKELIQINPPIERKDKPKVSASEVALVSVAGTPGKGKGRAARSGASKSVMPGLARST